MECKFCNSKWETNQNKIYIVCPFCQKPLLKLEIQSQDLKTILISYTDRFGVNALLDRQAVLQYIDLCVPNDKRERNFMNIAFSAGTIKMILQSISLSIEQQKTILRQTVLDLEDTYGVDKDWADYIAQCIAAAIGLPIECSSSFIELKVQAESGNPLAQFDIAIHYYEHEDIGSYIYWCQKAIQSGNLPAMHHFGRYKYSLSDKASQNDGLLLLVEAARLGDIASVCYLARNINDTGIYKDEISRLIFDLDFTTISVTSMHFIDLSYYYENCGDIEAATNYAEKAYLQDRRSSWRRYIDLLRKRSKSSDISLIGRVLREVSNDGDIDALYELGNEIMLSASNQADMISAIYWLKLAADYGKLDAQLKLAEIYENGNLVDKDLSKAIYWYEIASSKGSQLAYKKISFKCRECIRTQIEIVLDDGEELVCPVHGVVNCEGKDYLVVEDLDTGDIVPLLYTELQSDGQFAVESVDEDIESQVMCQFRGSQK